MAYTQDEKSTGLELLTWAELANGDILTVGDASDSGRLKGVLKSEIQAQFDAKASSSALSTEASTRSADDTTLAGLITSEASTRSTADSTLQTNIDAKVSLTDANLATVLTAATTDATPLDADFVGGIKQADSSLAKWTWTVLKAFLKTYFDSVTTTLTNKRLTPRVQAVTSSATVTPSADNDDLVTITAQAEALTIANPSGTPVSGQALLIRIKDNGTARAITFGSEYRAIGVTLPTTTVISKTMYIGLMRNSADTKWDVIGLSKEV